MTVVVTTDSSFQADVLDSTLPVLVDFTAQWCGPCRMIAPVLEQLSTELADRLRIVSLDVDANPQTTLRYQVMGMPTLTVFVGGELVSRFTGARPRTAILRELEPYLPSLV